MVRVHKQAKEEKGGGGGRRGRRGREEEEGGGGGGGGGEWPPTVHLFIPLPSCLVKPYIRTIYSSMIELHDIVVW